MIQMSLKCIWYKLSLPKMFFFFNSNVAQIIFCEVCPELKIYLSGVLPANKGELLKAHGIKYVLSIGIEVQNKHPDIIYNLLRIADHPTVNLLSLRETFFGILLFILFSVFLEPFGNFYLFQKYQQKISK